MAAFSIAYLVNNQADTNSPIQQIFFRKRGISFFPLMVMIIHVYCKKKCKRYNVLDLRHRFQNLQFRIFTNKCVEVHNPEFTVQYIVSSRMRTQGPYTGDNYRGCYIIIVAKTTIYIDLEGSQVIENKVFVPMFSALSKSIVCKLHI